MEEGKLKLTLKNFQSISSAVLEFNCGITAIVGASNSGKTATIRAIHALLKNPSEAKSYIKHGTEKAEVTLETETAKIKWVRTPKESSYEINGELYQKVGRTDLFELLPENDFYTDEEGSVINIQDEWSSLFPFDRTDSQIYKLFEDIFAMDENDSASVMKKIKEDELSCRKRISEIDGKISNNKIRIDKIDQFLNKYDEETLISFKNDLEQYVSEYESLNKDTEILLSALKIISSISKLPRKDFDFNIVCNYLELDRDVNTLKNNFLITDVNVFRDDFDFSIVNKYLELNKDTIKLKDNSKFFDLALENKVLDFSIVNSFSSLDKDCNSLINLLKELRSISEDEKKLKDEMATVKNELDSIDVCPWCGNDLKGDN